MISEMLYKEQSNSINLQITRDGKYRKNDNNYPTLIRGQLIYFIL